MKVVIVGAGFGGLETATCLSETLGNDVDVTLIDRNDSFVFGYAKLDAMFGRTAPGAIHLPYRSIAKPGVTFKRAVVTSIDPGARRVTTDKETYDAAVVVVALGAEYDVSATLGLPRLLPGVIRRKRSLSATGSCGAWHRTAWPARLRSQARFRPRWR